MFIKVHYPVSIDGIKYKIGTYEVPDTLKDNWYFKYALNISFVTIEETKPIQNKRKGVK